VQPGDLIVTIARDRGEYILGYIRQDQQLRPREGTPVTVRSRLPGQPVLQAKVESIGPRFEPIPLYLLRDPTRPEFGLPVRIQYPPNGFIARPGEPLDLMFVTRTDRPG
jgi:hypothetical protein